MEFRDWLTFDKMITPLVVKVFYFISVALVVVLGIVVVIIGAVSPLGGGMTVIAGLLMIFLGPVFLRLYWELIIVIFQIYETLKEILRRTPMQ